MSFVSKARRCGLAMLVVASLVLPGPSLSAVPAAVPIIATFLLEWAAGYVLSEFVDKLQGQDGATLKKRLDELAVARENLNGELRSLRAGQQQLNRTVALLAARDTARSVGYEALLMRAAYCSREGSRLLALYEDIHRLVLPAHQGNASAQRELYERLRAAGGGTEPELIWAECVSNQIRELRDSLSEVQATLAKTERTVDDHTRWLVQIQLYLDGIENERILEQEGRGRVAPAVLLMHEKSLAGFEVARSVRNVLTPAAAGFGLSVIQYSGTVLADDVIVSLSYECEPNRQIHECALRLHGPGADLGVSAFGPSRDVAIQNLQSQFSPQAVRRFASDLARGRRPLR